MRPGYTTAFVDIHYTVVLEMIGFLRCLKLAVNIETA